MNIELKISDEAIELLERYKHNNDCPLKIWNYTPEKAATLLHLLSLGFLVERKIGYSITPFGKFVLLSHKKGHKEITFDV